MKDETIEEMFNNMSEDQKQKMYLFIIMLLLFKIDNRNEAN